jgi:hypothetical protein
MLGVALVLLRLNRGTYFPEAGAVAGKAPDDEETKAVAA